MDKILPNRKLTNWTKIKRITSIVLQVEEVLIVQNTWKNMVSKESTHSKKDYPIGCYKDFQ